MKNKVVDMNGIEIKKYQTVMVRQYDGISVADVVEPFFDRPTINEPGHWVDIETPDGIEGMPSYILEVVS